MTAKSSQRHPADRENREAHPRDEASFPEPLKGILNEALDVQATDVHMDPVGGDRYRMCFRVDGKIHPHREVQSASGRHLINQVKVAAQVSPDHLFTPVESRIRVAGRDEEVRVTVMPTSRGEAAHLRILGAPDEVLAPDQLGISPDSMDVIRETLTRPEGLVLVSGATGSGKSMTLYSLISFLDLESVVAASIEDPVEYDVPYIRQVQADPEHGLSMYEGLRTLLRMDPDILMVGEIRDAQSALTAVRAAASGRFVLATLHARDAALAVEALHYYSVPRHLVGATLQLVISQALVRRVCGQCAGSRSLSDQERERFEAENMDAPSRVPDPQGCDACRQYGYRGRIGLFEVHPFTGAMGRSLSRPDGPDAVRKALFEQQRRSLMQDALQKVADGLTSMEEIAELHAPGGGDPAP